MSSSAWTIPVDSEMFWQENATYRWISVCFCFYDHVYDTLWFLKATQWNRMRQFIIETDFIHEASTEKSKYANYVSNDFPYTNESNVNNFMQFHYLFRLCYIFIPFGMESFRISQVVGMLAYNWTWSALRWVAFCFVWILPYIAYYFVPNLFFLVLLHNAQCTLLIELLENCRRTLLKSAY